MRTAAYARFSSDQQRAASIDDQLRNVTAYCQRAGWPAPRLFEDRAMTGARADRPGYQALLAAAERREFDVLLVDDLSRLSRDELEAKRAIRALTFWGIRVIGVSDGIDTQRKGHKVEVGLRGLMGELYLDDLADKTRRGLEGRALAGSSAGGLPFGYRVTSTGQRAVDEAQAAVVRRIFEDYAAGHTPRAIAATLNAERVPAARGGTWCMTAIAGDARRGIGILVNELYRGRMVWKRSHWIKDPFTGRRQRRERPRDEWITKEIPALRIVSDELWDRVQRRLLAVRKPGRRPESRQRYLLSGLLVCGTCGASMVIVDRYRYGCAAHKDRGAAVCSNGLCVARSLAEEVLLATVREEMLHPEAFRAFMAEAGRVLRDEAPDLSRARRALAEAQRIRDNLVENLRQGVVSAAVREALADAERAVEAAHGALRAAEAFQPAQLLPRAREVYTRLVGALQRVEEVLPARQALREILGEVRLVPAGDHLVAEMDGGLCQIGVVAGAGSVLNLTAPATVRVPLTRARILPAK